MDRSENSGVDPGSTRAPSRSTSRAAPASAAPPYQTPVSNPSKKAPSRCRRASFAPAGIAGQEIVGVRPHLAPQHVGQRRFVRHRRRHRDDRRPGRRAGTRSADPAVRRPPGTAPRDGTGTPARPGRAGALGGPDGSTHRRPPRPSPRTSRARSRTRSSGGSARTSARPAGRSGPPNRRGMRRRRRRSRPSPPGPRASRDGRSATRSGRPRRPRSRPAGGSAPFRCGVGATS